MPNHVIHDAEAAVELLGFKRMKKAKTSTGFNVAGDNVQFCVHDDNDANHSTVVVLKKGHVCTEGDDVVAYFCFPRLGLAVPMRPGDTITFNSQELHCLSSRTQESDIIYGMAIYMKSKVAGGNDNSISNGAFVQCLSEEYGEGT